MLASEMHGFERSIDGFILIQTDVSQSRMPIFQSNTDQAKWVVCLMNLTVDLYLIKRLGFLKPSDSHFLTQSL